MPDSLLSSCGQNDLEPFSTIKQSKRVSCLRIIPALLFVFSFLAFVLSLVTVVANEYVTLSVQENFEISRNTTSLDATDSTLTSERFVLIPQVDVSLGLNYVCVAGTCKSRHRTRGAHSFILTQSQLIETLSLANIVQGTEKSLDLYEDVYDAFKFGDDIGLSCGTNTSTIRSFSLGAVASNVLHIIFIAVTLCLSIFVYFLLFATRFLGQVVYIIPEKDCFLINGEVVATKYVLKSINAQIKFERPFAFGMIASTSVALVWGIVDIVLSLNLFIRKSKCGESVCNAFKGAMDAFYDHIAEDIAGAGSTSVLYTSLSKDKEFTCSYGVSFGTNIVFFILTILCFILSLLFIGLYIQSARLQRLRDVKSELTRIEKETTEKKATHAHSRTPTAILTHEPSAYADSPEENGANDNTAASTRGAFGKDVALVFGTPEMRNLEKRVANPSFVEARQESFFEQYCKEEVSGYANTNRRPLKLAIDDTLLTETNINKLGGRIAMLKQRKLLEAEEEKDRESLRIEEQKKFNLRRKQYNLAFRIKKLQQERNWE